MRIAFVTDSYRPTVDGVVTIIDTIKASLERLGHKVFIVAPDPGEGKRIEGVRYFPAVDFKSYEGYYVPILPSDKLSVLREIDPDIVHGYGIALMPLKGFIASRALKVPFVLTMTTMVADTIGYYSPLKALPEIQEKAAWVYMRWLMNSCDGLVVHTRCVMDELGSHGVKPKDGRIIPAGIDTDRFRPTEGPFDIRDTYGIRGKKVLMHVGRISYEKHVDDIVRAMAMLDGDTVLVVVGDGPAKQSVVNAAEECGVTHRVIFTGFIERSLLPEIYAYADVCVSCSRFETQGLSIMEAMACGKPVVCPDARAFSEIITDGKDGFLFDGGVEALAARISDALNDDGTVARAGIATAASYSEESCAKMLLNLYEDLIDRRDAEAKKRQ